ncbi:hypothetical protein Taro_013444 [Colocasia esculenta]|uniref:Transposase Tnp1/En/Spm-like domain-containing protein n=1 Tax=Colocasia esculenta TaxID=4460 RepID=A0A843UIR5_COLES|nr:hypothetical protein [Colocasia esculenta]
MDRRKLLTVDVNDLGQPVGPNTRKLASYLGTIARNPQKAPLTWEDWRKMPIEYKNHMWDLVKSMLHEESSPEENTSPRSMKDDLLSQVLGKDKPGRIRMLGLGPTPSSVYGPVPTRAQALQMVNQIKTSSETVISKMFEKIEEMKVENEKMKESYENRLSTLHVEVDTLKDLMQQNNENCQAHEDNASPSICSSASSREVQRGSNKRGRNDDIFNAQGKAIVYLRSFKKSLTNVALATIESKDPLKKVGGCDLGYEYWEVAINVALVHNEPLPRPYAQFKTIEDAIGATIAWPFTLSSLKASSRLSESDSEQEVKEVSEFTCSSPTMKARFAFSSSSDSELEDSELQCKLEA